jgi:hypothetical protein
MVETYSQYYIPLPWSIHLAKQLIKIGKLICYMPNYQNALQNSFIHHFNP